MIIKPVGSLAALSLLHKYPPFQEVSGSYYIPLSSIVILAPSACQWLPFPDIFNISKRSPGDIKFLVRLQIRQTVYLVLFIASKSLTHPNTCIHTCEMHF